MTLTNSIIPEIDQSTIRRRTLAKVYSLLIRLAEEAEQKSVVADSPLAKPDYVSENQDNPLKTDD